MPKHDSYPPGVPCWVDLMSPDIDASTDFLTSLFGWDAEDQFDDDGTRIYVMMRRDGLDVAGVGGQPPGVPDGTPPVWNTYVATNHADTTVTAAQAAGGGVMMPVMDVMDAGRMAVLTDPADASICIWEPGTNIGAQVTAEPNTWVWSELLTRDRDGVRDFYAKTFGWSYDERDMGPSGTYVVAQVDGAPAAGLMAMPDELPERVPNHWMVYFEVEDVDEACTSVRDLGGVVVAEPFSVPGVGRMATIHHGAAGSFSLMTSETRPD